MRRVNPEVLQWIFFLVCIAVIAAWAFIPEFWRPR